MNKLYDDLEKHFRKLQKWNPEMQSFFDHYKRIPRKLKKKANTVKNATDLGLHNRLWYLQQINNSNYNLFLIKLIIESSKK